MTTTVEERAQRLEERLRFAQAGCAYEERGPGYEPDAGRVTCRIIFESFEKEAGELLDEMQAGRSSADGWERWRKWRLRLRTMKASAQQAKVEYG